jgi:hypothetical protein
MQLVEEMSRRPNKSSRKPAKPKQSAAELDRLQQVLRKALEVQGEIDLLLQTTDSEEHTTTMKVRSDFFQLRELLNDREQQILRRVADTHEGLRTQLTACQAHVTTFVNRIQTVCSQMSRGKADRSEVSEGSFALDLERLESLRVKTGSLPVKVNVEVSSFEDWLKSHVKMLDQTEVWRSPLSAVFVRDVRVFTGDSFMSGVSFVKTWRLKNDGEVAWPEGCWCIHSHGDFNGEAVIVDSAYPQEEVDISVVCTSPSVPGRAWSYWRLTDPDGQVFGPSICVEIVVQR